MTPPDFVTPAQIAIDTGTIVVTALAIVGFIITGLISIVAWLFSHRMQSGEKQSEATTQALGLINENIGVLKAARDRSKEADDKCREDIEQIRAQIHKMEIKMARMGADDEEL